MLTGSGLAYNLNWPCRLRARGPIIPSPLTQTGKLSRSMAMGLDFLTASEGLEMGETGIWSAWGFSSHSSKYSQSIVTIAFRNQGGALVILWGSITTQIIPLPTSRYLWFYCLFVLIFMVMLSGWELRSCYIYKKLKVTCSVNITRFPPLGEGQRKRILRAAEISLLR